MTVKIAKLFSGGSSSNNSSSSGASTAPPPLPPPNPKTNSCNKYYKQQQQQQHQYNAYDDDDNMSLYSSSGVSLTARDHPFNNSQRPLLASSRGNAHMLQSKQKKHQIVPTAQQQHQQQQLTSTVAAAATAGHQQYISPYVQQQKRDSAKGLHGFNDFDILSQQYNKHLQSPHIGYPYGSPPSPTATSSDFVFDGVTPPPPMNNSGGNTSHHFAVNTTTNNISTSTPRYGNVSRFHPARTPLPPLPPLPAPPAADYDQHDYYSTAAVNNITAAVGAASINHDAAAYIGKSSRFEDDFCCRRNDDFSTSNSTSTPTNNNNIHINHFNNISSSSNNILQASASSVSSAPTASCNSGSSTSVSSGPFIFGVPHEQQCGAVRMPSGGRGFVDTAEHMLSSGDSGVSVEGIMQSTSDTSSSSRDSSSNKGAKLLLRKNKSSSSSKSKSKKKSSKKSANVEQPDLDNFDATKKPTIKCVVVGDGAVGKTNLILSYLENRFIPEHVPTASDIYNADVMVNENPVHLTLCDTAGQDTLDPLRELCYPDSDVFLLCFSVAKPETFHAIKTKWAPKFAQTRAALILVGTQADLRTDESVLHKLQTTGEKPISFADAWDLATTIGAKYIETSSATQDKVKEVFDTAIWEGLRPNTLPPTPPLWKKLLCLA